MFKTVDNRADKTKVRTVGLWLVLALVLALVLSACQPVRMMPATQDTADGMEAANKAVVQRFYDEVVNQKNMGVMAELFDANFVPHDFDYGADGGDLGEMLLVGLPDVQATVSRWVVQDDLVTAIATFRGTHTGAYMGIAPTGNPVSFTMFDIFRLKDGKITDLWHNVPVADQLEQIGFQGLKPGDKVGGMTLSAGPVPFDLTAIPPFPAFCDPTPALKSTDTEGKPGAYTVECTMPPLPKLHIGGGWIAADEALRDANWNAQHKEVYVNGQLIDESAFGSVDADVPVLALPGQAADEVAMVKLRVWNIVLENLPPGTFTLHHVMRLDEPMIQGTATMPAGVYDYTYKITVDPDFKAPEGEPAPVKITN